MITVLEREQYCIEDSNVCFLNGPVDGDMTEYFTRFVLEKNLYEEKGKNKPNHLKVIINSPGGDVTECFAMIDIMNAYPIPVWTYGVGQICSAGLMLFIAGTHGKRHVFKNTSILSHQWSGGGEGKEHELKATEKEHKLLHKRIYNLYEGATGLSREQINEVLLSASDTWLSPTEAVKYGLADRIISKI